MGAIIGWFSQLADVNYVSLLTTVADVLVVTVVTYKLMMLVKGTRAWQILWGLGIFSLAVVISKWLNLQALNWLLQVFLPLGPVALVILFYPELRHALEEVGRLKFLGDGFVMLGREDINNLVEELTQVATDASRSQTGILIVVEREVGLDTILATGKAIDAEVSSELLRTIFHPGSPLHDGAVIVRGDRIVAAGCILPLSDSPRIGTMIHTRHKAAVGVTEQSDAVVLVVSEETGTISISTEGLLLRGLTPEQTKAKLLSLFQAGPDGDARSHLRRRVSTALSKVWTGSDGLGQRTK